MISLYKRLSFVLALSALVGFGIGLLPPAHTQTSVIQSGNVTGGHAVCWVGNGIVNDCGVPTTIPYALTSPLLTLVDSATVTPDVSLATNFTWTIGATGRTLANPANLTSAFLGMDMRIYVVEDGTGSRTITTYGSGYKFSGGTKPTLSTGAGAVDRISCFIRSTTAFDCVFTGNFQ